MLHFINTRPADRAKALTVALTRAGYQVSQLPLLELLAEPFDQDLQQQLGQIKTAHIVVVVSPTAVQLGLTHLASLNIDPKTLDCHWVAVGQGTAALLQQAGLRVLVPTLETSEGMLALDVFEANNQPVTVMFWRGYGGRRFMLQTLQSRQNPTISINLYRRQLPLTSQQYYSRLQQPVDVLLISSGASWQNWLALAKASAPLIPAYIVVLGERVQQQIMADLDKLQRQASVLLVADLLPASILPVVQQIEQQHKNRRA